MCHAELRFMAARLVKTKHEQTDPATIDERHLAEIQDYLAGTAHQKSPYAAEELAGAMTDKLAELFEEGSSAQVSGHMRATPGRTARRLH